MSDIHIMSGHDADAVEAEILRLRAENEKLRLERDVFYVEYRMVCDEECKIVHAENEKLRAALEPFAQHAPTHEYSQPDTPVVIRVFVKDLRAAAAALKGD